MFKCDSEVNVKIEWVEAAYCSEKFKSEAITNYTN